MATDGRCTPLQCEDRQHPGNAQYYQDDHHDKQVREIFKRAIEKFRNSLKDEEKNQFQTFDNAEDVVKHIRKETRSSEGSAWVDIVCRRVHNLSESLTPYFDIIGIFVQSNPEIPALFWGAVRLIFQVCGNYASFADKLSELLDSVSRELSLQTRAFLQYTSKARELGYRAKSDLSPSAAESRERLVDGIAELYADLLGLCRHVCDLFSSQRKGTRYNVRRLARMFWTPFDSHFEQFRKCLRLHLRIVKSELDGANSNLLLSQLAKARDAMTAQVSSVSADVRANRLTSLKVWLDPPMWQQPFEDAKGKRTPATSVWILETPEYKSWCDTEIQGLPDSNFPSKVLQIHGKPGYGKTVLCATILDHLRSRAISGLTESNASQPEEVVFYFFDKQRPLTNSGNAAFRAIATQLLHGRQQSDDFIDLALILRDVTGSGQPFASNEEVRALVSLYLDKLQAVRLVLDGLDECSDLAAFLRHLCEMVDNPGARLLLSSRPNVTIDTLFTAATILALNERANFQDILVSLEPEIERLVQQGMLFLEEPISAICQQIAKRSHGMFLWAGLMINYLKSDFLDPEDRAEVIRDTRLFEELDRFYTKILNQLYNRCPSARARTKLRRLFHWVAVAQRPLTTAELRSALAIETETGGPTIKSRYITNFNSTLVKMSGALIEISGHAEVRFIHASVFEFFTGAGAPEEAGQSGLAARRFMVIDLGKVHESLALDCLSYILHDTPRKALKTELSMPVTTKGLQRKFPLLLYATQFWPVHASMSLSAISPARSENRPPTLHRLACLSSSISKFLAHPEIVTAWTEISWTFGLPPSIHDLSYEAERALTAWPELTTTIANFEQDLQRLNADWSKVLKADPAQIWKPSIPSLLKSKFWVGTDAAIVVELDPEIGQEAHRGPAVQPILVGSRLSGDGTKDGLIKVIPSQAYDTNAKVESFNSTLLLQNIDFFCQGLVACYNVISVQDKRRLASLEVKLPTRQVAVLLLRAVKSGDPTRFEFPVSFSEDLRTITVLTAVIRVNFDNVTISSSPANFCAQDLELRNVLPFREECPHSGHHDVHCLVFSCVCQYDWYQIVLSPDSRHLAVMTGPSAPDGIGVYANRPLAIYKDRGDIFGQPDYRLLVKTDVGVSTAIRGKFFIFHPYYPLLAVSCRAVTTLWMFAIKPRRWVNVQSQPLDNLCFSHCGRYLQGTAVVSDSVVQKGSIVMINLENELVHHQLALSPTPPVQEEYASNAESTSTSIIETKLRNQIQQQLGRPANLPPPATLTSNSIVFNSATKNPTDQRISFVRRCDDEGAIIMHDIGGDGNVQEKCITRLPQSNTLKKSNVTFLSAFRPTANSRVKLAATVIDMEPQRTYGPAESQDMALPVLIVRKEDSIPIRSYKRSLAIEEEEEGSSNKRRGGASVFRIQ